MPFETFQRQRQRPEADPVLTIQKGGVLSLNYASFKGLDSPEAVELLYDRENRLVGLRKVSPDTAHAYAVRPLGKNANPTTWLVSGRSFVQFYGIEADTARRWIARFEHEMVNGPMLVVDLKEPALEPSSSRSRRQEGETTTVT